MAARPAASVLIPARDAGSTLPQTLASVYAQTRDDWEAVVVDAGSTDDTAQVVRDLGNPQVRLIRTGRCTPGAARNLAAGAARSPVVCLLDADDEWLPETLEHELAGLAAVPDSAAVFGDCVFFNHTGEAPWRFGQKMRQPDRPTLLDLLDTRPMPLSTIAIRADAYAAAGGFSSTLRSCEDYDLWYRMLLAGSGFARVPQVLARIRIRAGGLSDDLDRYRNSMRVVLELLRADERLPPDLLPDVLRNIDGLALAAHPHFERPLREKR
ncbi:MAG: glycosyltransferase [Pseudonocardiaceae bacterium]